MTATHSGQVIAKYIAEAPQRSLPPKVADIARMCLADWLGVAVGAGDETAGRIVREVVAHWRGAGQSTVLFGDRTAAPYAALANGTLAHCLDFDDTYIRAITHMSAPVWAATLAVGDEIGASEEAMLSAFVTGFEVASHVGDGLGEAVTARGWHGTGVFGRLGAAAAAATLLQLDSHRALNALGAAATQIGGLTASFGTMAKPFHAGRAAMDGVVAAQLAHAGFEAATGLLESGGGLDNALVQDRTATMSEPDFANWNILENSFKPYASCHLTHPAIDAGRVLRHEVSDLGSVTAVHADIGALAEQVTGHTSGAPTTSLEAKFDLKYCVALALHGYTVSAADFREPWHSDPAVRDTATMVTTTAGPKMGYVSARLTVDFIDGRRATETVPVAKGHPGNPMSWADMWAKFEGLTEPVLAQDAGQLFSVATEFGSGVGLDKMRAILGGLSGCLA